MRNSTICMGPGVPTFHNPKSGPAHNVKCNSLLSIIFLQEYSFRTYKITNYFNTKLIFTTISDYQFCAMIGESLYNNYFIGFLALTIVYMYTYQHMIKGDDIFG